MNQNYSPVKVNNLIKDFPRIFSTRLDPNIRLDPYKTNWWSVLSFDSVIIRCNYNISNSNEWSQIFPEDMVNIYTIEAHQKSHISTSKNDLTIFGNSFRFLILALSMACLSLIMANTSILYFTVMCMNAEDKFFGGKEKGTISNEVWICNDFNDHHSPIAS